MANSTKILPPQIDQQEIQNFSVICDKWFHIHSARWKISSKTKYQGIIEKYFKPHLGPLAIEQITVEEISRFSNVLLNDYHLAAKTSRDILLLLHEILDDARRTSGMTLPSLVMIYPKEPPKTLRVLTHAEQQQLVRYLNQDTDIYKFAILLALSTGLRIGEICGLRWGNISTQTGILEVKSTVQRIKNPDTTASAKTIVQIGTPKTYSSIRTIPLTESICRLCCSFYIDDPEAFVLTGNTQFAEPRTLQRKLKNYTDACYIQNVHFHTLRHTFATRCVEVGCDVKTLSEILGHANISMTMNRYVHPSLELKRQNLQKLDQAGFGSCVAE